MSECAERIRAGLRAVADPERAVGQQAYMKSAMPFLGVRLPDVRRIVAPIVKPEPSPDALRALARELWDDAEHREERYAGMAVLAARILRDDLDNIPLIEHMVATGQWWDFTDDLAHRTAALHDAHPVATAQIVTRWSTDSDMWLRRSAIISQLGRRDRLDSALLAAVIEPNLADREFFIRKAIGWALREYARVNPAWVREYAGTHDLSPLSRREALRHL